MFVSSARARARVRAPELRGRGGWLNTGGQPLTLAELRGKIVLLDFWTFCCVNCLHVIDELREHEERWRDVLVVIGIHSPKFEHETDHAAVAQAVERYDVRHPVLDDPELATWSQYAVRAWPTLVVVDPEGYVVAQLSGEGHGPGLDGLVAELVAEHEAKGTLHRGDGPYSPPPPADTDLRFPAKVLALPDDGFLVSDSGHHSLAVLEHDAETVRRRIGTGHRGLLDGPPNVAQFSEPGGVTLLPTEVAARVGYDVVVADTANHVLRGVSLTSGAVRTVAGTGQPWRPGAVSAGPALDVDLSSPWDVAWCHDRVVIAMAGIHQLWAFDPISETVDVLAGTTAEGLNDGPARAAMLAQPSGLAVSLDGRTLWFADSENSALRCYRDDHGAGTVETVIGTGLFDFGHRDGAAEQALLQHPLGVVTLPDGSVGILDTYNNAARRYDPATRQVSTLAMDVAEPSAAVVVAAQSGDFDLVVVESAAHRLTRLPLAGTEVAVAARSYRTQRPATDVAAGPITLEVAFTPPTGQHLDDRYGPATRLRVSAAPPELLSAGTGAGTELRRELVVAGDVDAGVLHISASAASCETAVEHPACHIHQQDWGIPIRVTGDGQRVLRLPLRGV